MRDLRADGSIRPQRVEYAHDDNYHVVIWYDSGASDKAVRPRSVRCRFLAARACVANSVRNDFIAYLCVDDAGCADWVVDSSGKRADQAVTARLERDFETIAFPCGQSRTRPSATRPPHLE